MPIPHNDPLVTIPMVTPFDQRDQVDHDAIRRNIVRWQATPLSGFIVGTATGEEYMLSEDEKLAIVATVVDTVDEQRFVVGGIDCDSVSETIRRATAFAEAGAEMVRVRFPREPGNVLAYFQALLPECPLPVLLMHQCNPERFGMAGEPAASAELIGQVAALEGVFGYVTDHDIRFEARVREFVPDDRRFWICNGSIVLAGTLIGCNGTTTAFSNVWPSALYKILQLGMDGRYADAQELQRHVARIDSVMLPYRAAGVKAALNLLGFEGSQPRSPAPPMPADEIKRLASVMREAGLLSD